MVNDSLEALKATTWVTHDGAIWDVDSIFSYLMFDVDPAALPHDQSLLINRLTAGVYGKDFTKEQFGAIELAFRLGFGYKDFIRRTRAVLPTSPKNRKDNNSD